MLILRDITYSMASTFWHKHLINKYKYHFPCNVYWLLNIFFKKNELSIEVLKS